MCGRGIGNLLFPLIKAGVLANESARPATVVTLQSTCPNCKSKVSSAFDCCPECGTGLKLQACAYCGIKWKATRGFVHRAAGQAFEIDPRI
jgi:predicted amidophosphoribosyltransferase